MSGKVTVITTTVPMSKLLGELRPFFNTLMLLGHADVAKPGRVPIDTNALRGALSPGGGVTMVDPKEPPMWAAVGVASTMNPKGGDTAVYGGVLEASSNHHYLDGPSAGQPTQGWLSQTIPNIQGAAQDELNRLAASVEGAFTDAQ